MLSSLLAFVVSGTVEGPWEPTATNYKNLLTAIRPSEKENSWKSIGWRNQFWPAVQEAKALGRPILLWTMNGHPLGCT